MVVTLASKLPQKPTSNKNTTALDIVLKRMTYLQQIAAFMPLVVKICF